MFRKALSSTRATSSFATRVAGVVAVAALAVGGVAVAQTAAPIAASGAHAGGWHHHHGGFEHQLMKLHAQLNLTSQQEALWQQAVATTKANRQQERTLHQQDKAQMQAQTQVPILDLSGMHAQREQQAQQFRQLHEQTVQAWLNVYSALNDQQKTLVSSTLKADWAQMQARQAAFKQRWEQQHQGAASAAQ
jgi:periplasmic protein CpxP/Spy